MPEGDTVFVAARRLDNALRGKTLTKSDFRVPRYATVDLAGRRVEEVVPRGKHLLFRLSGGLTLHTHFKMDGAWRLYRSGRRWTEPAHEIRAVLHTNAVVAVGLRLPVIELLPTEDEGSIVGHLGPDPLSEDWDAAEAERRLAAQAGRAIGEALLDQSVIAGLGNVYKVELCFLLGLDPWTLVKDAGDPARIVDLARRALWANRATGAHVTTGDTRRGRTQWVYGRPGRPCHRCGTPIRQGEQDGYGEPRVVYWCPHCQPPRGGA